ncbi:MAG: menaquinone biosynthesis protein [Acidobacteria bacterium]|nr:menaquinone biosynthesis protein [Acidobacteriota bacterium]
MAKLKIAASTYLNSAPLIYSFLKGSLKNTCDFIGDAAPSRCADLLKENLVDIALIPVIEYQSIKEIHLIPDVAIAAKESVKSVILVTKCPINKINSVSLDTSSRTSATLVKIILEKFYQIKPFYLTSFPNLSKMLSQSDAALIIGDPAIKIREENSSVYQIYDLAQEWRKFTKLPFVFACWGVNKRILWSDNQDGLINNLSSRLSSRGMVSLFIKAKEEGLSTLEEIVKEYSKDLEIDPDLLLDYLTSNVNYDLDKENLLGLELFYNLAFECGLINKNHKIEFLEK